MRSEVLAPSEEDTRGGSFPEVAHVVIIQSRRIPPRNDQEKRVLIRIPDEKHRFRIRRQPERRYRRPYLFTVPFGLSAKLIHIDRGIPARGGEEEHRSGCLGVFNFPQGGFDDVFLVVAAGIQQGVGGVVVEEDLARHAGCEGLEAAGAGDEDGEDGGVVGGG